MLEIKFTSKMKRDFKRVQKRGYDMSKLDATLRLLVLNQPMPSKYRDHQLKGDMRDYRECHVDGEGDWLLLYQIFDDVLILSASGTGTHADLFDE
jgi:mRNA interferase YafQ